MTWAELYRAADTRAKRTLVIRLHRRAWFAECWCWPSQHEQARQLGCSKNTVRIALHAKRADLCHKRGRIRFTARRGPDADARCTVIVRMHSI